MAVEVFKRKENKYLIGLDEFLDLENKIMEYMEPDQYNKSGQFYTIGNIYYDTKDNQMIRHSLSRPKYKEKLRLRSYGIPGAGDMVFLEIKKKVCRVVNKRRTLLTLREAYDFAETGIKPVYKEYMNRQVLNEIEYLLKIYPLEPKLYLAYDRKAYFGKDNSDLRLTFDTGIRTRRWDLKLEKGDYGEYLLDKDQGLVEIKTEGNIPLWLTGLLSQYRLFGTSFSKYGKEYQKMLMKNTHKEELIYA